jgi:Uncharacterised nucleotidyltransferase
MHLTQPLSVYDEANAPDGRDAPEGFGAQDSFLVAIAVGRLAWLPEQIDDPARLLARIAEHRLAGRCRRYRVALEERRYPTELIAGIDLLHHETLREYRRNSVAAAAAFHRFGDALGAVIKGFSSYLLTGDESTLRCGDIDLVVDHGAPIVEYLLSQRFERTRPPFMHEIGEFTRDGVEIDLQANFPVSRYPPGTADTYARAVAPCGTVQSSEIRFDDLQSARVAVSTDSGRICVPSLEMAVLIAAAHGFMNFTNLWSISHREKAWVRLCELADMREMASAPAFSRTRFRRLVEQFRAHDVVAWADWIWTRLSGTPVLTGVGDAARRDAFPMNLWWNLWVAMRPDIPSLLAERWYPLAEVTRLARAAHVELGNPPATADRQWRSLVPLWQSPKWRDTFHLKVRSTAGRFDVALRDLPPRPDIRLRLRLETEEAAEEFAFTTAPGGRRFDGKAASVRLDLLETSLVIEIDIAALHGTAVPGCDGFIGLLIEEQGEVAMSTVVPLGDG